MSIKDGVKSLAGRAATKVKKAATKAFTSNLSQAKKLLPLDNLENEGNIEKGEAATLILYPGDFISFANQAKENALDKLNKIGELLATSLLTKTTTNKLNDFRGTYYSSQKVLEEYRNKLFTEFSKEKDKDLFGENFVGEITDLLRKDDLKGSIEQLSERVYSNGEDALKLRKKFCKKMESYFKAIGKNYTTIKKILSKKGDLQKGVDEEVGKLSEESIAEYAEGLFKANYDDIGTELYKITNKYSGVSTLFKHEQAAFCAGMYVLLLPFFVAPPIVAPLILSFAWMNMIFCTLGALTDPGIRKNILIKKCKSDCNKVQQATAQIFKNLSSAKKYVLDEIGNAGSADETGVSEEFVNIGNEFIEKFKGTWNNYADDKNRMYGYFDRQENAANLEAMQAKDKEKRERINKLVSALSGVEDEKSEYNSLSDEIKKQVEDIHGKKTVKGEYAKHRYSVESILRNTKRILSDLDGRMEDRNKLIEEQKTVKLGRSKTKTSSMGLFKDGFAKTLAKCTCEWN